MSGVYIPNINLPERCDNCPHPTCRLWQSVNRGERHEKCPIVPVPDHGRLVDADALEKLSLPRTEMIDGEIVQNRYVSLETIRQMPTIIQADKEKANG